MAHEGDMKMPSTSGLNGSGNSDSSMEGMDMSGKDKNMDMSNMDMNGKDKNMDMSGTHSHNSMPGMEEKPLKETLPNAKVLGTYGAVNAAFIIIGVWNKWFRRKDGSNGNSN